MPRNLPPDVELFPGPVEDSPTGRSCGCAWRGCTEPGQYPAPKDRRLAERYMFCLEHVRAYNAQWDFHKGLSAAELEEELRDPATWGRPTWKLGALGGGRRPGQKPWNGTFRVDDPLDLGADTDLDAKRREKAAQRATPPHEARALKLMGLSLPLTMEALRRRYMDLVKKYHPDANGGSADAETRMKHINAAYQTLRAALTATG